MKARKSKLDAHADQLGEWQSQNLTLAEMQSRLAAVGCTVSLGRLSGFLESLRQQELQARVLGNIASGSRMNREVEFAFRNNPEPELKTLVSFIKRLLLTLQVEGSVNPELLISANALFKSLMDYLKVEQKAQELALSREKFELLKAQAEKAGATEQALDNAQLTDAQRAQRIKEIYGRA
jgi:DNA-binding phage protein